MPTWNIHIVGQNEFEDLGAIGADIVDALESRGHTLVSAVVTTDDGSQALPVAPPPETEPETPPTPDVPTDTPPGTTPPADAPETVA